MDEPLMNRTATDLLGAQALSALRKQVLDEARGLPAALYTSDERFELEQHRLFPRTWIGIAFDTDVMAPGDAIPLTICGRPLILVRGDDGVVQVLHNVCRHRATIVLEAPATGLSTFKCPYHVWVYGIDGALKATPFWDGTADSRRCPVDAANNGLSPVRSGVWNHVVFVNLDGNAVPLEMYLAPLAAEQDHLDLAATELGHRRSWQFKANWKLVMENREVYRHVWVHHGVFHKRRTWPGISRRARPLVHIKKRAARPFWPDDSGRPAHWTRARASFRKIIVAWNCSRKRANRRLPMMSNFRPPGSRMCAISRIGW
jgi:phenylpropionate dioxygenase-like ring-hydroxylating dioxygenase large terminal subunit